MNDEKPGTFTAYDDDGYRGEAVSLQVGPTDQESRMWAIDAAIQILGPGAELTRYAEHAEDLISYTRGGFTFPRSN